MRDFLPRIITAVALLLVGVILCTVCPPTVISVLMGAALLYILCIEWPQLHSWYLTPVYPLFPSLLLIFWNQSIHRAELLFLIVLTYAHDTGAYLVGSLWGTHKLAPRISPGKSWEGAFGGLACSLLAGVLLTHYTDCAPWTRTLGWFTYGALVFVINAGAVLGDLFESSLKRRRGIKDSGSLLPGHGGLLDRFDSIFGSILPWTIMRYLLAGW